VRIEFPYAGYERIAGAEVPDRNLMGVYAPRALEADEEAELRRGMAEPIGAPRLREAVRGGDRVLVLIDDATRETPVARMLPHVLAELEAAGVPDGRIELLQAPGTHRPMTDAELRRKLGPAHGRFRVHAHDWLDRSRLHDFGRTRDGTPVTANRLLAECDFVLGLGGILPHRVKGMSGGAKIVFPGVSGPEMMGRNQWEASTLMAETVMGVPENPMRLRMEEAARMAGLRYVVNVVYDVGNRVVGCFAGDPVAAHRAGSVRAGEVYAARLPRRADVVIVDSHPADRDLWQSCKGPYAATMAVKDGGTIVLVSPNPEGVAKNHENLLRIGYRPRAELRRMVEDGEVDDLVGVAVLADLCQIVDHANVALVSPGVEDDDARRLGLEPFPTVQAALDRALERHGAEASVAVLHFGGHILPVVEDELP
jgi:nickel-dependent lactate racemase